MATAITVPRLGWTMEEGVFLEWLKRDGDPVRAGEPIFTLESDKAAQEVEATDGGTLRISPAGPTPGSVVRVGAVLGYLVADGEVVAFEATPGSLPPQGVAQTSPPEDQGGDRTPPARPRPSEADSPAPAFASASLTISPRAARTAAALKVDWATIRGTGRTGRIRERDVLAAASANGRQAARAPSTADEAELPGRVVPLSATRRTIARRMSAGVHEAAPVTLTARADATQLLLARERAKAAAPADRPPPTLNDYFVKLVAAALVKHPALNAQWRGDAILIPDDVNIALAVETDGGLLAPVLHGAASMALHEIAAASRTLIELARAGRLAPGQLRGGTFTVTNLGRWGVEAFTPIVNLPQCATLGVGRIASEPAVLGDAVVARQRVPLSLTFDHRAVDGAPAARFLEALVGLIESAGQ